MRIPIYQKRRVLQGNEAKAPGKAAMRVFVVVGCAIMTFGAYRIYDDIRFRGYAERTEGVVSRLHEKRDKDGKTFYYPVVEWVAPDSHSRQFTGKIGSSPPSYRRGERVEVFFDPADYDTARLGGWVGRVISYALLAFGGVFVFVGGWLHGAGARQHNHEQWLRQHGIAIRARIGDMPVPEAFTRMLGKIPSVKAELGKRGQTAQTALRVHTLFAQWQNPRSGKTHYFTLADIPAERRESAIEQGYIELIIDEKRPHRYILR